MKDKIISRFIFGICIWGILMFPIGILNAAYSLNKASGLAILFSYLAMILAMSIAFKIKSSTSQTKSSNEDFPNGEHNISLKGSSNEDSQISSNDETSLNNNIKCNFTVWLPSHVQLNKQEDIKFGEI